MTILGRVAAGQDPADELKQARLGQSSRQKSVTFKEVAELFLAEHMRAKRKARTANDYEALFRLHAYPPVG